MKTQATSLKMDNVNIHITFKNIKNIHLRVYPPDGQVRISVPKHISKNVLKEFLFSRLDWIKAQQAKIKASPRHVAPSFVDSEQHYFNGESHLLKVIEHRGMPKVEKKQDSLHLYLRPDTPLEKRQFLLNEWYRQQLKNTLPPLIAHYEPLMGVKVNEFRIKNMKTRWGTCNPAAKRIWLNLELAKKPPKCLEYVVVHEMVHLLERSHNQRFVGFMNQFMPQWRTYKKQLNDFPHHP